MMDGCRVGKSTKKKTHFVENIFNFGFVIFRPTPSDFFLLCDSSGTGVFFRCRSSVTTAVFLCVTLLFSSRLFVRSDGSAARLSDARGGVKRVSSRRRFKTRGGGGSVSRGAVRFVFCRSFVLVVSAKVRHGEDARDVLF